MLVNYIDDVITIDEFHNSRRKRDGSGHYDVHWAPWRPTIDPFVKNLIVKLRREGLDVTDLSILFNIKREIIRRIIIERTQLEKKVIELYRKGVPVREIKERLGVSNYTLYKVLRDNGVHLRIKKHTKREIEGLRAVILEEYRRGTPIKEIKRKYGISYYAIYKIIKEAGLELRRPTISSKTSGRSKDRRTPYEEAIIRELVVDDYRRGTPIKEITKKYRVSTKTVYRIIKEAGVELRRPRRRPRGSESS